MPWDTVQSSVSDHASALSTWETDTAPTSVDKISTAALGRDRLVTTIQYTA
jgi:hypothetical protein